MAKINYSKVEQMLQEAIQKLQYKQLSEGKPIISSQAQEYYGISNEARPVLEEVVEKLLDEEAALEKEKRLPPKEPPEIPVAEQTTPTSLSFEPPSLFENEEYGGEPSIQATPMEESIETAKKRLRVPLKRPEIVFDPTQTSEKFVEKTSPLYLLRQHIFWMKRQHLEKRYEILKTTKEEIDDLRRKSRLTEKDLIRIQELINNAKEFRSFWLKKQGMNTSDDLILEQKKKHKNKRFNVREKWLPI